MTVPIRFQCITVLWFYLECGTFLVTPLHKFFKSWSVCAAWWVGARSGSIFRDVKIKAFFQLQTQQ